MAPTGTELVIAVIASASFLLIPLVSRLIGDVGEQISRDVENGFLL